MQRRLPPRCSGLKFADCGASQKPPYRDRIGYVRYLSSDAHARRRALSQLGGKDASKPSLSRWWPALHSAAVGAHRLPRQRSGRVGFLASVSEHQRVLTAVPPLPNVPYSYHGPQVELRRISWGLFGLVTILPGPGSLSAALKSALAEADALHITIRAGCHFSEGIPLPESFDQDSLCWALQTARTVEAVDPPTSAPSQILLEAATFSLGSKLEIECLPELRDYWTDFAWRNHFVRVGAACSAQAVPMWIWPEHLPSA